MHTAIFLTNPLLFLGLTFVTVMAFGFLKAPLWLWTLLGAGLLVGFGAPPVTLYIFVAVAILFNIKPIRAHLISRVLMKIMMALKLVPKISETEKTALNAGAVWVESDFFSGKPDFKNIMKENYPELTDEEKAYINGPIEKLCCMIDDWKIYQNKEIPPRVLDYMREIKLFGMIVPKKYGGLEFSAMAHSEVIMKLSSRSIPVTITAMVPNSLGPAELLAHFGTEEQKNHYLPKLATGEYIPCFALTEQRAGSDAGSIESNGELFKKNGELWIRLNWNKRWITLASISNILGLAFELRDPDRLIGDEYIVGITCALIPSETEGVVLGDRHDPLGVPFYNCPTQGENVEVPASSIIGGIDNAGKGWTMLMESLGAGRGISLPAQACGSSKLVARITSSHTSIRRQFGVALCKLEGIEEPLARIAGLNYTLEAMRRFTVGALDKGIKPSVVTAMAKYNSTEFGRTIVNDGMDIMAGTGITRGPRNLIANIYTAIPIGITVEGANILTRTLIVFGQGLMRAHPWAYKEVEALEKNDLKAFDVALWGHVGHIIHNFFRSCLLSLTRGHLVFDAPFGRFRRTYQKLSWASSTFALLADVAMGTLGGKLKQKEMLCGRFADILSWLYMCTAVIKRYQAEGEQKKDLPFVEFSLKYGLIQIQESFDGILGNLKIPGLTWVLRFFIRPWTRMNALESMYSDELTHQVADAMLKPGESRDRLTEGIYYPTDPEDALGRLENAYRVIKAAEEVENKITRAMRKKLLPKKRIFKLIEMAKDQGIINDDEVKLLNEAALARWDACQVDSFTEEGYHGVEECDNKVFREEYIGPGGAPQYYRYKKGAA